MMVETFRKLLDLLTPAERRRSSNSVATWKRSFLDHLFFTLGRFPAVATRNDLYLALAHAVRDIDGGRPLQRREHLAAFEQDGIGIGAADVDSDAAHAGSPPKTL